MKGLLLAGGEGTRLYPMTQYITKHLLPIYDKPMIYYSLTTLMLAGITDIIIITNEQNLTLYKSLLKDGKHLGLNLEFVKQSNASGIAEAILLSEKYIENEDVAVSLGDNLFYGQSFTDILTKAKQMSKKGAVIFAYPVKDPRAFGVVEFAEHKAISLEEKPLNPKSKYAVPGLYFYDSSVVQRVKQVEPSQRGELEITDLNKLYLEDNSLYVMELGRGMTWFDAGTPEMMLKASEFVSSIQSTQGFYISSPEEIAWRMGYINLAQFKVLASEKSESQYGKYLLSLLY